MNKWPHLPECPVCLGSVAIARQYERFLTSRPMERLPGKETEVTQWRANVGAILEHLFDAHDIGCSQVREENVCVVCNLRYPYEHWAGDVADHMSTHTWEEVCAAIALIELGRR